MQSKVPLENGYRSETMLLIVAGVGLIFFVLSAFCYLRRLWYFQDIKGMAAAYPLPVVMDAIAIRNSQKLIETLLYIPKKFGYNTKGFKLSIGHDSFLILFLSEDISAVMNSLELISKGKDYKFAAQWIGDGLLESTGKKWIKRRKLLTPTFHFAILKDFVPTFEAIGDVLIEVLNKKANGSPIEVFVIFSLYNLDVISETSLGISIDALRNEDHKYVVAIKALFQLLVNRGVSWWKRFEFLYKFSFDYRKFKSWVGWIHDYTYKIIDQRRETIKNLDVNLIDEFGIKKKFALLDMLIKSTIDGAPLSNEDIREEVDTFMVAGLTSSSALSFILYCLSQHPEIQEKLLIEQEEILGKNPKAHATYEDLNKMNYLEMVIKEVSRLYPAVAVISREVQENISMEFGTLKKGLQLVMAPMVTHRNPQYFPDPEKFDPERFSPENIDSIKPFTYIPFSGGYRNCIGQRFAMLAMKSAISKIVRNFKVLPDLTYKPILVYEVALKSKNGIWVKLEKRL